MPKFVPKEVVKQAKEIDLLTYFMNNNPSELVRKGTNTYSLKSHEERFKIKVTDFIMSQSTKDIEKYSKKFSSLL